jgi:hypothetical protein
MWFFFVQQLAVAACWSGRSVLFFWTLFVQVPAPAPQTARWLFAFCPDVVELLAVVALCESALGSISLHPDSNVAEAWQMENFLGFCCSR